MSFFSGPRKTPPATSREIGIAEPPLTAEHPSRKKVYAAVIEQNQSFRNRRDFLIAREMGQDWFLGINASQTRSVAFNRQPGVLVCQEAALATSRKTRKKRQNISNESNDLNASIASTDFCHSAAISMESADRFPSSLNGRIRHRRSIHRCRAIRRPVACRVVRDSYGLQATWLGRDIVRGT